MRQPIREIASVAWHANGGFTRLQYELTGSHIEIPTEKIPEHLRQIGSRVMVVIHPTDWQRIHNQDELRRAVASRLEIEPLPETSSD